jgi:hypothetical protein
MQPINYTIDVKNPLDSALQGYQTGLQINAFKDAQQQKQLALEQQAKMQSDFNDVRNDPTPDKILGLSVAYPQQSENLKRVYDMQNTETQKTIYGNNIQLFSALQNNKPEVAEQLLTDQIAGFRNAGKDPQAHAGETLLAQLKASPNIAKAIVGGIIAPLPGGKEFLESFGKQAEEDRKAGLYPSDLQKSTAEATIKGAEAGTINQKLQTENDYRIAQTKDINNQITDRSARLSLDKDKFQSDVQMKLMDFQQKAGTLDGDARKQVNDLVINSVASEQTANQYNKLADNLENIDGSSGAYGSAKEWLKGATGNQDAMSEYKKEYNRLRSSQVSKMLPPGSASDADVKLALSGFPPENADPKYLASFLRGMAKLSQYSAINDNAKAEWVNSVGHLGKSKNNITIDGINVPAGTTFPDFSRPYLEAKTEQRMIQGRQDSIKKGGAPYMNTGGASGSY